jgi:RNA polymerase sigma-70 factor (ECF subfamily)
LQESVRSHGKVQIDVARLVMPAAAGPANDQTRNPGLVERLYRDHWKSLCARLRRVFGNGPPEPEDLAQTAFAKLIEYTDPAALDDPASYLFRIAINSGRDRVRHVARAQALIAEQLAPQALEEVDRITPSNVYETRERLAVTERAIATLTPKQREVLMRSRLKGETFEEIRDACGWSKADISRTLQAALGVLQSAMREYAGHE